MNSVRFALAPALGLVALLVGGCTALHSEWKPPVTAAPPAWQQHQSTVAASPGPGPSDAGAATTAAFWTRFGDPQLDVLIDDVLRSNNNLAAAGIRLQRAQLQAEITGTNRFPDVQAQATSSRSHDLKRGRVAGTHAAGTLTLGYELDAWGRLAALRDAADGEAQATEFDRQAIALSLIGSAAALYWQIGLLNQRIALSNSGIEDVRRTLALVQSRHAAGAVSGLDLAQARQSLAGLEAAHTQLMQQRVEARHSLALLLDRPPETAAPEPVQLPSLALPRIDPDLPASLLGRRPDLRAAEQRLRGAFVNIDATRFGFYPALSLTGSLGTSSGALGDLLRNPVGTLGASMALPFLQWNTMQLKIRISQTQYEEAVVNFRQSLYTAFSEVENALSSRTQLRLESEQLQVTLAQAQRAETLTEARYRAGAIALQLVLDAKDRRRAAEVSLAQNRLGQLNASMALYKALGGDSTLGAAPRY